MLGGGGGAVKVNKAAIKNWAQNCTAIPYIIQFEGYLFSTKIIRSLHLIEAGQDFFCGQKYRK